MLFRSDYEAELVAVIGRGGRHIAREDALAAVFGYCCGNDATERAWQHRTPQWVLGKSFDTHAPFGPWITTADETPDPHALAIRCLVNDEVRQDATTAQMVFPVAAVVSFLSRFVTLEPGDLIATVTPSGVGSATGRYLKPGDVVRASVTGIGTLENPFTAEGVK